MSDFMKVKNCSTKPEEGHKWYDWILQKITFSEIEDKFQNLSRSEM